MEDYPKTLAQLEKRFGTEEACRDYLYKLRWQDGFICPKCKNSKEWSMNNGLVLCSSCRRQISVMQGTVFQDSHLPLLTWFRAMWHICVQKNGISALGLQRALGLGSYRTAWMCLHKLRQAMVRPGREKLSGEIEVDETYLGGEKSGKRGRGAEGKSIVLIAAERDRMNIGRIRLSYIPDVSNKTLDFAIQEIISDNSLIITDGWSGYNELEKLHYQHQVVHSYYGIGKDMLPRCHRVASLLRRWIMGTLQGSFGSEHLQGYLNEFTFRFNRRKSISRGNLFYRLAQQAVQVDATPYLKITKPQYVGGG